MDKIKIATMQFAAIFVFFSFLAPTHAKKIEVLISDKLADAEVVERLGNIESIVSVKYSKEVQSRIKMYVHDYPQGAEKLLGRVSLYFPLFDEKLRKSNLPQDLRYLAVIESALEPSAVSKSGAAGLWQFMKSTGKMYGLYVDHIIDERRDPIKSTDAAIAYLGDLYRMFDDWTLALAAYNGGPGNVRKAIRKSGGKRDFWSIRSFLPKETQEYIPRFIAATYLMKYYHTHDLVPDIPSDLLRYTATARIYDKISFSKIRKATGLSMRDIERLNPSFIQKFVPSSKSGNYLTLPEHYMSKFLNESNIKYDLLFAINQKAQELQGVQNLSLIGKRIKKIQSVPSLEEILEEKIEDLLINTTDSNNHLLPKEVNVNHNIREYEYYKLSKRESIIDILARRPKLRLEEVLALNNFDANNLPKAGSLIKLRAI